MSVEFDPSTSTYYPASCGGGVYRTAPTSDAQAADNQDTQPLPEDNPPQVQASRQPPPPPPDPYRGSSVDVVV